MPDALYVTGSVTNPSDADNELVARLQALGYTVQLVDDNAVSAGDAIGNDVVVVSESSSSGAINTKFRDVPVPVVMCEGFAYDEMNYCLATSLTPGNEPDITILDPGHPIAAGYSGTVQIHQGNGDRITYCTPAASAINIASIPGNPTQITIFAFDVGALMENSFTAPARRVGAPFTVLNESLTAAGGDIFDALIAWVVATPSADTTLDGAAIAIGDGATTGNTSRALTPSATAIADGIAGETIARNVGGAAVSAGDGLGVGTSDRRLNGPGIAVSDGMVATAIARALTGSAIAIAAGEVTASSDAVLQATAIAAADGEVSSTVARALGGIAIGVGDGFAVSVVARLLQGAGVVIAGGVAIAEIGRSLNATAIAISDGALEASGALSLNSQAVAIADGLGIVAVTRGLNGGAIAVASGVVEVASEAVLEARAIAFSGGIVEAAVKRSLLGSGTSVGDGVAIAVVISAGVVLDGQAASIADGIAACSIDRRLGPIAIAVGDGLAAIAAPQTAVSSPFPVNATLTFQVPTGDRTVNELGNPVAVVEALVVKAYLVEKRSPRLQSDDATELHQLTLEGRCIDPPALPASILPGTKAIVTIDGLEGEFILSPVVQSPWPGVVEALGAKLKGTVQARVAWAESSA
ncbi:MAG: hypothetical protein F6J95_023610 [Leptolyngbya sp. SIO1E4]|nr:hypothetical protein [Leptolyngbya sp. SIO1E4]